MPDRKIKQRVETLFSDRKMWEPLWDTAYRYIAPERGAFFDGQSKPPSEVQSHVFDSTAIDAAERLANLLLTGMIPPWQQWFRQVPGFAVETEAQRAKIRPIFETAQEKMANLLEEGNFYQEMQPVILDREVGGTGCLMANPTDGGLFFRCVPLHEIAIAEDEYGRLTATARKTDWTVKSLRDIYSDKIDNTFFEQNNDLSKTYKVLELNERQTDGQWRWTRTLCASYGAGEQESVLDDKTESLPRLMPTRWSKMPGHPYGRGPGLRALSDVRALNKIKELSLKNAALATSGVYTVTNDGVVNAYTLTIEPGARIPVLSNNPQEPSIAPLPMTANFDVSMFTMEELRDSIKKAFMADQFAPLGTTPLSATEVAERTRIIASEMGATISRMQNEVLTPTLQWCMHFLRQTGQIPEELQANGSLSQFRYVSRLSQAQWAEEKSSILSLAGMAAQFGAIDPQAGMVIDFEAALRRVAELDNVPTDIMRPPEEVEEATQRRERMMTIRAAAGETNAMGGSTGGTAGAGGAAG